MAIALYRKPIPGLIAFTIAFGSQWLGHTAWTLIRGVFGEYHEAASILVGTGGAALVWAGLKRAEVPATWMGFLGGLLIWVGWFELTFEFYAQMFDVGGYTTANGPITGGAAILMSTMPIGFALFLVYGYFNRQTKCNLIRWFHRNLHLDPGMPTPDNGRSIARITALETLFVTWACYLFWLYVGYLANNTVIMTAYVAWFAWFAYIFMKLTKIPRVGMAVRYGIPVGIVGWGILEMPSHFGLYSEIWLQPYEYPLVAAVAFAIFLAGVVYVARQPGAAAEA